MTKRYTVVAVFWTEMIVVTVDGGQEGLLINLVEVTTEEEAADKAADGLRGSTLNRARP